MAPGKHLLKALEMAETENKKPNQVSTDEDPLHFDVSTGLKRVLGRELITDDEVAIFELVKNSFDAQASTVYLYFSTNTIVVADNGNGMSYNDLKDKWLFVAYSAKRESNKLKDYRDVVAQRRHYAGSKGIGRFSSDRLGETLILQSRSKSASSGAVSKLRVDWEKFEKNDKEHFESVPVDYLEQKNFELPEALIKSGAAIKHGTVIEISKLHQDWARESILSLKASLAKLINPFGDFVDRFNIVIVAPHEIAKDKSVKAEAAKRKEAPYEKDIVNGPVGNFIFSDLREKTTFIVTEIEDGFINTTLTDRGEVVYKVREPNKYHRLESAGFRCELFYLNQSAKITFTRRVGLPSVQFGSVFLFRNGFRVYPIGEDGDDWFAFDRRKQQGYARFLGTREIIGKVDVSGADEDFQEASSRNQGLIETPAVRQLKKAVMDHGLKRLEKYVVPVSWKDDVDGETEDLSRLLTDPGRARVSAAVANLVDNDQVELLEYSKRLIGLLNIRSSEFESSIVSLRMIAEKSGDKVLLGKLDLAERKFEELKKSESEAVKVAERERAAAAAAMARADAAEEAVEIEKSRSYFLESAVTVETSTILNLHHQVTLYAVDLAQQIENFLAATEDKKVVARSEVLAAMEQIAYLNRKILAITRFAARAKFKLDSEKIETDLAAFVAEYIDSIAKTAGSARTRIEVSNDHPSFRLKFNPIDVSIVIDNLVSNARKARASRVKFDLTALDKGGLQIRVSDNGVGISKAVDRSRIFEMGYTATRPKGSGLGLYHVRQVLGEIGGSIELLDSKEDSGTTFLVKISEGKK
jgi:signal transduction histidine kinase